MVKREVGVAGYDAEHANQDNGFSVPPESNLWFENNAWTYPMLPAAETALSTRRNLCVSCRTPQVVIIRGERARGLHLPYSSYNSLIIDLPRAFNPSLFSWPVAGVLTAVVCTGPYERSMVELCLEYKSPVVETYDVYSGVIEHIDTFPEIDDALLEKTL